LKRPSYIATKGKLECLELEFGRKWHIIDRIQNSGDAFEDVHFLFDLAEVCVEIVLSQEHELSVRKRIFDQASVE
jgi:hypothetical protein